MEYRFVAPKAGGGIEKKLTRGGGGWRKEPPKPRAGMKYT